MKAEVFAVMQGLGFLRLNHLIIRQILTMKDSLFNLTSASFVCVDLFRFFRKCRLYFKVVCNLFTGYGSTFSVMLAENRKFIGIEKKIY